MRLPRHAISFACALAVALSPASAFAQSAGDEQYQDPFGDEPASGQSSQDSGGSLTQTPQATPPKKPKASAPGTLADVPQAPVEGRLAETGIDTRLFLAIGAAMLLGGVGLRMRTRPERF